jgi:hypothetical protein
MALRIGRPRIPVAPRCVSGGDGSAWPAPRRRGFAFRASRPGDDRRDPSLDDVPGPSRALDPGGWPEARPRRPAAGRKRAFPPDQLISVDGGGGRIRRRPSGGCPPARRAESRGGPLGPRACPTTGPFLRQGGTPVHLGAASAEALSPAGGEPGNRPRFRRGTGMAGVVRRSTAAGTGEEPEATTSRHHPGPQPPAEDLPGPFQGRRQRPADRLGVPLEARSAKGKERRGRGEPGPALRARAAPRSAPPLLHQ